MDPNTLDNDSNLKRIAQVCIGLRKLANYFQDNDPEHLSREDFDQVASELEDLAAVVDNFLDEPRGDSGKG
ncbi:hypothetical protein [Oceanidesulfovibrio marinus]|uniref:Uncharacterized protein n=1 Tax=Oceanidesulfovibrio marinus TaxID=370038 RepID=A0ABX6NHM4_9BACT|nr:hypothetical protein [Oceanidesulfovibrio marinus]QJT10141.1 hypothetical protein E8L03_14905 [Oceanidesulfovibrio marinus]